MDRRSFFSTAATLAGAWAAPAGARASWLSPGEDPYALVLGSLQDGGLPQPGCYSERCERARAGEDRRRVASLALVEPSSPRFWLVDASPDIGAQMDMLAELHTSFRERASDRRPFDGIFLTHAHVGHYLGLALLGNEALGMSRTPCYATPSMLAFLEDNAPWSLLVEQGRLDPRPLVPGRWRAFDPSLSVQPIPVPHRDEFSDTVAFAFRGRERTLLYLPDIDGWRSWDRDVAEVVGRVDVALLDGTFFSADEVPGRAVEDIPHPLVPHTMDLLGEVARRTRILFTHLNNTNPALDEGSREREEIRRRGFDVAREGMRIEL